MDDSVIQAVEDYLKLDLRQSPPTRREWKSRRGERLAVLHTNKREQIFEIKFNVNELLLIFECLPGSG